MTMQRTLPYERFSSSITLHPEAVSTFAHMAGDENPLHHDPLHAARSRYGRLIASGPQTTAHLMALSATHFARRGPMVGIEFWFRFRRAIFANETIHLEWLVISVKENARLNGDVIELRGRIKNQNGETAIGAKGRVLITREIRQ